MGVRDGGITISPGMASSKAGARAEGGDNLGKQKSLLLYSADRERTTDRLCSPGEAAGPLVGRRRNLIANISAARSSVRGKAIFFILCFPFFTRCYAMLFG